MLDGQRDERAISEVEYLELFYVGVNNTPNLIGLISLCLVTFIHAHGKLIQTTWKVFNDV